MVIHLLTGVAERREIVVQGRSHTLDIVHRFAAWTFEGTLSSTSNGPSVAPFLGDGTITGEIVVDPSLDPPGRINGATQYNNVLAHFSFDTTGVASGIASSGRVEIQNDASDRFTVRSLSSGIGPSVGGLPLMEFAVVLADNTGSALSTTELATIPPDIFVFPIRVIQLDYGTSSSDREFVTYELTRLEAAPIPAALPLFTSAIAGLGYIGWHKRRAASQHYTHKQSENPEKRHKASLENCESCLCFCLDASGLCECQWRLRLLVHRQSVRSIPRSNATRGNDIRYNNVGNR